MEYFSFIDAVSKTSSPYKNTEYHSSFKDKSNNHNLDTKGKSRAYSLVVMTSPSHGGGQEFESP